MNRIKEIFGSRYKSIIILIIVGIILLIIALSCSRIIENNIRQDIMNSKGVKKTEKIDLNQEIRKDWGTGIYNLFLGNYDLNTFPLSKDFKLKFNSLDKIIPGKVRCYYNNSFFDNYDDSMTNIVTYTTKTGNGLEEIAYQLHYVINDNNELDDIEILDSKVIEDENGEYIQYDKYDYYKDDPIGCTYVLVFPQSTDSFYKVYVTDKFKLKFPNYEREGILGDKDYLIYGEVKLDKENKEVCYAECLDIEYTKNYKITYTIDKKGYIDDAEIELYEIKKTEDPEYVKKFYEGWLENY